MASHKKRFLFYNDWLDYLGPMGVEEKAEFLETILKYQNGEEVSPMTGFRFVRPRIRTMMDIDRDARDKRADVARSNGSNGGRPKKTQQNPLGYSETQANPEKPVNVNVNDTVNDNDNVNNIIKEENTTKVVPSKPKSIINKQNKPGAVEIYDKIKEMCVVVDGTLDDCVVLRSKLVKYGNNPVNLLEIMITKMRDTGLSKFYSVSNPGKLADNIGTIVEKLKSESKPKKELKVY